MIANAGLLPSTGYPAVDGFLAIAAVVAALAMLWRTVVRPTMRAFNRIDEYGPVLTEIAKQFRTNNGSSARDILNRLEQATHANTAAIKAAKEREELARATLDRLAATVQRMERRFTDHPPTPPRSA